MEEDPLKATKKPRSKPGSTKSPMKRPPVSENNSNQESKRVKKKAVDSDVVVQKDSAKKTSNDTKKQLFQRLWSEKDEIVILKEIAGLKKKYENNASKSKMGEDRTFSKAHAQKAYELSKRYGLVELILQVLIMQRLMGTQGRIKVKELLQLHQRLIVGRKKTKMQVEPSAGVSLS